MTHDEHGIMKSSEASQFAAVDFLNVLNHQITAMMITGSKSKLFII